MIKINPLYIAIAVLIMLAAAYLVWLRWDNKYLKQQLGNQQTAAHVQQKKDEAEIFSKDQLIRIKEPVHHDEINLSVGTHTLAF